MLRFRNVVALLAFLISAVVPVAFANDDPPNDGRYMIEFHSFNGAAAAVRAAGGSPIHEFPAMSVVAAHLPAQAVRGLQNNPNVKLLAPEQRRYRFALWNDSKVGGETTPYGVQMVQANVAPFTDVTAAITNRTVCIIDSGYYRDHEDLPDTNVNGYNGNLTWYQDGSGHGSHVAGTIVGTGGNGIGVVGVIPKGIKLFIVRVFGDDGAWAYESDLINALDRCRTGGANVVSMSLGGGKPFGPWEQNAFDSAYNAGVLSIAAAGNAGNTSTSYPAGYASVVSVAAVDANELVADFSQKNADVEIAAPGVSVFSTLPYKETNTLSISSGPTFGGGHVGNSPRTAGSTGGLADGGLCDGVSGTWSGKVVLCQRGSISFKQKLDNVKAGGGTAGVIYNNVSGGFLGTCDDGTGTTCTITGISLSMEDGDAAKAYFGSSSTVLSTITQPASGYDYYNGTSMATPHVSAVAGLIWSYNTGLSNQQIRDALNATAADRGAAGRDNSYGYGIVQAKAAFCYLNPAHTACGGGGDPNAAPSASFSYTTSNLTGNFTDTSTDSDGTIASRSWNFGDGGISTAQNPSHTYAASGTYTVSLTVTDNDGATATASQSVTVSSGSTGGITLSTSGYKVKGAKTVDLTWSGATSTSVDVFRDGSKITTTANDGAHTDSTGAKGGGSHTYKVCEAGTTTCSNESTVSF